MQSCEGETDFCSRFRRLSHNFIKIFGSFCSFNSGFTIALFCLREQMIIDIALIIKTLFNNL